MITNTQEYLDQHLREYLTEEFGYASYSPPNTMYNVSNDLDELLLTLSYHALKMWHRSLSRLRRNPDPVKACSLQIVLTEYSDILSRNYYYKALDELIGAQLIHKTPVRHLYVINITYANKLYKPKLEIE